MPRMTPWNQQLAQINNGVLLFEEDEKPEPKEVPLSLRSFSSNETKESVYEGENDADRHFFNEFKSKLKTNQVFSETRPEDFDRVNEGNTSY